MGIFCRLQSRVRRGIFGLDSVHQNTLAMALIVKATGGNRELVDEGLQPAVCVDVVDLGHQETEYGTKHQVQIVWEVEQMHSSGDFPLTVTRRYTVSLNEKSRLFKDLNSWRGKPFTDEELKGFDLESVIGAPCVLDVVKIEYQNSTYNAIDGIQNVKKMQKMNPNLKILKPSETYVRVVDREESWDVRSDNYVDKSESSPDKTAKPAEPTPKVEEVQDDLPF